MVSGLNCVLIVDGSFCLDCHSEHPLSLSILICQLSELKVNSRF